MTYRIRPITQFAVINEDNGLPIAVCKDKGEAEAIIAMMARHDAPAGATRYEFSDWARH